MNKLLAFDEMFPEYVFGEIPVWQPNPKNNMTRQEALKRMYELADERRKNTTNT